MILSDPQPVFQEPLVVTLAIIGSRSCPGAAAEVSLLCPRGRWRVALFIEKQTNHNRKIKYLPGRTRGRAGDGHRPERGEQSLTVERRPTGAERQLYAGRRQEEAE